MKVPELLKLMNFIKAEDESEFLFLEFFFFLQKPDSSFIQILFFSLNLVLGFEAELHEVVSLEFGFLKFFSIPNLFSKFIFFFLKLVFKV
jgi:hypothetical protein